MLYGHETWLVAVLKGVPLFLFLYFIALLHRELHLLPGHRRDPVPALQRGRRLPHRQRGGDDDLRAAHRPRPCWSRRLARPARLRLGERSGSSSGSTTCSPCSCIIPIMAFNLAGGSLWPVNITLQAVAFGVIAAGLGAAACVYLVLRVPARHRREARGGRREPQHRARPPLSRSLRGPPRLVGVVVLGGAALAHRPRARGSLPAGWPARLRRLRRGASVRHRRRRRLPPCSTSSACRRCAGGRAAFVGVASPTRARPATGICSRRGSGWSSRPCWRSPSYRAFGRMARMTIATADDLRARLAGVADHLTDTGLEVHDEAALRGELMDDLAFEAVFNADAELRDAARWVIWSASQALGCGSASIHELYRARGRGEVPATALHRPRHQRPCRHVPDRAPGVRRRPRARRRRGHLRDRQERDGLHRAATGRVHRRHPGRRAAQRVADAGLPPGRPLPVQRHEMGSRSRRPSSRACATSPARPSAAGFLNIDIDTSTLVDLSQPTVAEQQRVNAENSAELTRLIRSLQPDGVTISIGGEIGEVGKANSTEEELRAYIDGYLAAAGRRRRADQQGQRPDRHLARRRRPARRQRRRGEHRLRHAAAPLDGRARGVRHGRLRPARRLDAARRGLPPLPGARDRRDPPRDRLPEHPLRRWRAARRAPGRDDGAGASTNCADERKDGETEEQFLYKTRKKAIGPFKRQLWTLPPRGRGRRSAPTCARSSASSSTSSASPARATWSSGFVTPVAVPRPLPAALGGGDRRRRGHGRRIGLRGRRLRRVAACSASPDELPQHRLVREADQPTRRSPATASTSDSSARGQRPPGRARPSAPRDGRRSRRRAGASAAKSALDGSRVAAHEDLDAMLEATDELEQRVEPLAEARASPGRPARRRRGPRSRSAR